jgi:hypothetical protein
LDIVDNKRFCWTLKVLFFILWGHAGLTVDNWRVIPRSLQGLEPQIKCKLLVVHCLNYAMPARNIGEPPQRERW